MIRLNAKIVVEAADMIREAEVFKGYKVEDLRVIISLHGPTIHLMHKENVIKSKSIHVLDTLEV